MNYIELAPYARNNLNEVLPGTTSLGAPTLHDIVQIGNGCNADDKTRLEVCRFDSELTVCREDGRPLQVAIAEPRYNPDAPDGEKFSKELVTLFDEPVDSVRFVHFALATSLNGRRSWFIDASHQTPNSDVASRFASTVARFAKDRQVTRV